MIDSNRNSLGYDINNVMYLYFLQKIKEKVESNKDSLEIQKKYIHTFEISRRHLFAYIENHYEIYRCFIPYLKYIDFSKINFDNVDLTGINVKQINSTHPNIAKFKEINRRLDPEKMKKEKDFDLGELIAMADVLSKSLQKSYDSLDWKKIESIGQEGDIKFNTTEPIFQVNPIDISCIPYIPVDSKNKLHVPMIYDPYEFDEEDSARIKK